MVAQMNLSLQERCSAYARSFPKFPAPQVVNGTRIESLWIMGNCYQTSGYYGAYPHGYLDRVMSMFPDVLQDNILHLFSGSLPPGRYARFDRRPESGAEYIGDANNLAVITLPRGFDMILADPPYSQEDAEHYGTCLISRKKVMEQCACILKPGGWLIWLDQVLPMFGKKEWDWSMAIGMVKSTNHRVRGVFGFRRK